MSEKCGSYPKNHTHDNTLSSKSYCCPLNIFCPGAIKISMSEVHTKFFPQRYCSLYAIFLLKRFCAVHTLYFYHRYPVQSELNFYCRDSVQYTHNFPPQRYGSVHAIFLPQRYCAVHTINTVKSELNFHRGDYCAVHSIFYLIYHRFSVQRE